MKLRTDIKPDYYHRFYKNHFQELLGIRVIEVIEGQLTLEMGIKQQLLNPMGIVHGGCIASFADTCAGDSVIAHLPEGAKGFTTLEFKCNFVRAAKEGFLVALSNCIHAGRTTQVWQVEVKQKETEKIVASFNCTQLIIY